MQHSCHVDHLNVADEHAPLQVSQGLQLCQGGSPVLRLREGDIEIEGGGCGSDGVVRPGGGCRASSQADGVSWACPQKEMAVALEYKRQRAPAILVGVVQGGSQWRGAAEGGSKGERGRRLQSAGRSEGL